MRSQKTYNGRLKEWGFEVVGPLTGQPADLVIRSEALPLVPYPTMSVHMLTS